MTPQAVRYSALAIAFHWALAALILVQIPLGLIMVDMPRGLQQLEAFNWHKSLGAVILAIAALRLLWRLFNRGPALPREMPGWQKGIAHATHWLLYAAFFAVPLSGWTMSSAFGRSVEVFGLLTLPDLVGADKALGERLAALHEIAAYALAALVVVHVGAALQHFLIKRDDILARMLPFARWPSR